MTETLKLIAQGMATIALIVCDVYLIQMMIQERRNK